MKYKHISQLIQYFEQFESEMQTQNLPEFAAWLVQKTGTDRHFGEEISPSDSQIPDNMWTINGQIGALLGRMGRFARFYTKKAFEHLSIHSAEEFGLLMGIKELGKPSKSELMAMTLTEMTTGGEMLRRLCKAGLIDETTDEKDKRTKRLCLTPEGEKMIWLALQNMIQVGNMSFDMLSTNEKTTLLTILSKLNSTHTQMFRKNKEKNWAEIAKELKKNDE